MRWIGALVECTETAASAVAEFGPDHFAVVDGLVSASALVECMAQTVAAAAGQRARCRGESGSPAGRMLAAVTNFRIVSRPPAGARLRIEVQERRRLGPMLQVTGVVSQEGLAIATGELTVYA